MRSRHVRSDSIARSEAGISPARFGVTLQPSLVQRWRDLAVSVSSAWRSARPSAPVDSLRVEIASEPESPLVAAYALWAAHALRLDARYDESLSMLETAMEATPAADPMLKLIDFRGGALRKRAEVYAATHRIDAAIQALEELSRMRGGDAGALYDAGRLAEQADRQALAAEKYSAAARLAKSTRTDDSGELARRALARLESRDLVVPSATTLAELLTSGIRGRDGMQLAAMVSSTHFAVGPIGGHTAFEPREVVDDLLDDLASGRASVRRRLRGGGGKRYLETTGWTGRRFRGAVCFILTRAPRGWQWTGIGLANPTDDWAAHWRPQTMQKNQPLPFPLLAPWPAGQSFTAGGFDEFLLQEAIVLAWGPLGAIVAEGFSLNACGFGTRGFYYNEGSTHDDEDAFAIDFTRYRRGVPYDKESFGTPVLAPIAGVVCGVRADRQVGDPDTANMVELMHPDPATAAPRFMSRYLHLAGPGVTPVLDGMPVLPGDRLGLMDDTGTSVVHHLHFSIHDQNVPFPGAGAGASGIVRGASVRPTPLDGTVLDDAGSNTCVRSTNRERRIVVPIEINDTSNRDQFLTQHFVHTESADGFHLWTLTGVVILSLRGSGERWRREQVNLGITVPLIPRGRALQLRHWAPFVTINAVGNDNVAHDAGWALDWFRLHDPETPKLRHVLIETQVAVRDSDGWVYRLGYEVTLSGTFVEEPPGPF